MYSNIEMTAYAYWAILSHLVDFEERRNEIVNELYCEPSFFRDDFSSFLDNYLNKLEDLVKAVQIVDKVTHDKVKYLNCLPCVIIGSNVELESDNNRDTYLYRIISPYDNSSSKNDLSYISALGRALMLKKPGDVIKAEINKGICTYKIKTIRYECNNELFQ